MLTNKEVEQIAKQMLKDRKKLPNRIKAKERQAEGRGLRTSMLSRRTRLSQREVELAVVGRAYTQHVADSMHVQKAENLFGHMRGANEQDQIALDEITGMMIGSEAWGAEGVAVDGVVHTFEKAAELAAKEAQSLREEMNLIDEALDDLASYDEKGASILRLQYVEGKSVVAVMMKLTDDGDAEEGLAESTYHYWRKGALREFGRLVGLC